MPFFLTSFPGMDWERASALLSEQYLFQLRFGYCHNIFLKYLYLPIPPFIPLVIAVVIFLFLLFWPRGLLTDVHSSHEVRDGEIAFW